MGGWAGHHVGNNATCISESLRYDLQEIRIERSQFDLSDCTPSWCSGVHRLETPRRIRSGAYRSSDSYLGDTQQADPERIYSNVCQQSDALEPNLAFFTVVVDCWYSFAGCSAGFLAANEAPGTRLVREVGALYGGCIYAMPLPRASVQSGNRRPPIGGAAAARWPLGDQRHGHR